MPLTHIEHGSLALSSVMNNNFEYLADKITSVSNNLTSVSSGIYSSISGMNNSFSEQIGNLESDISTLETDLGNLQNRFNEKNNAPNYSQGIGITLPYKVPADGYVYAGVDGTDWMKYVYVNGKIVHGHCGYSGGYNVYSGSLFRVSEGDVVTVSSASGPYYFYPMKGV